MTSQTFGRLFAALHTSHGTLLASLRRTEVHLSWLNEIAVMASHTGLFTQSQHRRIRRHRAIATHIQQR
jgi:hypothetical protein